VTDILKPQIIQKNISGREVQLISTGDWKAEYLGGVLSSLEKTVLALNHCQVQWDVEQITQIDGAGMLLHIQAIEKLEKQGCRVELTGQDQEFVKLYRLLQKYRQPKQTEKKKPGFSPTLQFLEDIGRWAYSIGLLLANFLSFIGENFVQFLYSVRKPGKFRFKAIIKNIEDAGFRALPIIALTSFLIGVVIAYQGAVQLEKFGANIFIVDMIGISITRELAPLITAIVVAGRTGSSYTAQLGVMKLTEEIDAMRTMGFEPHRFLVLPRILALMLALPLLIFFADIIGIGGGMLISNLHLNISFTEFVHRLQNVLDSKHVWIGLGKGPFFAWLIAIVGCFNGFQVAKDTESIGRYTTISVVNAIFLVIACDAVFSVILTELGI
jgi:phospholipid/cholesterol/gamma-HCH transport system permease protein